MKTILTTISLILTLSIHGQIGLGGLKSKVKEKATSSSNDNSENKKSNGDETVSHEADDKEKLAISKSPASSAIWDYRIALKSFEQAPTGSRAMDEMAKAEQKLEQIKKQDPSFSYIPQYEKWIKEGKAKRESLIAAGAGADELKRNLDEMANVATFFNYSSPFDQLRRSRYDSLEVSYNQWKAKGNSDDYLENRMEVLIAFYGPSESKNVAMLIDTYKEDRLVEKGMRYVKESRQKEGFQESFDNRIFDNVYKELNSANDMYQMAILIYPNNPTLISTAKEYKVVTDDLNTFKTGGELDELMAKKKEAYYASVRMDKSMMTDAAAIECIKKELLKDDLYKSFKRIIILDSQWQIKKNAYGAPLYKYIRVQFAYTNKEGGCSFTGAAVHREYDGSSYGPMYANMNDHGRGGKILCENVNK